MTIQWFTVVAQIINFLVLVYLLQRFLYGPIVRAMDKRQAEIASRIHEADEKQRQAEEEAAAFRRKKQELDEQREQMVAAMQNTVEERRKALLQEARDDIQERERQWLYALQREQADFLQNLRRQTGRQVYMVAERALADLADAELDGQAVRAFLRHIHELDSEEWRAFMRAVRSADGPIVIESAFDLPQPLRDQIRDTLQAFAETQLTVRFVVDPNLLGGLRLQANHNIAAWNLDGYLDELASQTQAALNAQSEAEARSGEGHDA